MKVKLLVSSIMLCILFSCSLASSDHVDESIHVGDHQDHENENSVISLSSSAIQDNNIKIALATSKIINQKLSVIGKIVPELSKQITIFPRFSGIVKSIRYQLGDFVKKNDVLITIESNQSLQNYSIRSPMSGEVVKQYANVGNLVKQDKPLYELADLSSVWVELFIYRKDVSRVSKGELVYINHGGNDGYVEKSVINYISPLGDEHTQSIVARATLPNADRKFIPGLYVDASIIINTEKVPVAVKRTAIQEIDGKKVVFIKVEGNNYEPRTVKLGVGDNETVQILSGIKAGDKYVAVNSFILKSELEKGSAEHSH